MKTHIQCQILVIQPHLCVIEALQELMAFAEDEKIPSTVCSAQIINPIVLAALKVDLDKASVMGRNTVLLCGAYLEEQILVAAQYALEHGFDLYLLRDLIVARDREHAVIHDQRLVQAGAVITTFQQVLYEWLTLEPDIDVQARFTKFFKKLSGAPR